VVGGRGLISCSGDLSLLGSLCLYAQQVGQISVPVCDSKGLGFLGRGKLFGKIIIKDDILNRLFKARERYKPKKL